MLLVYLQCEVVPIPPPPKGRGLLGTFNEFDEVIGQKFAKHRCKTNPFVLMTSDCLAEFNLATVKAIMDVKAQYIKANFSKFYRPE